MFVCAAQQHACVLMNSMPLASDLQQDGINRQILNTWIQPSWVPYSNAPACTIHIAVLLELSTSKASLRMLMLRKLREAMPVIVRFQVTNCGDMPQQPGDCTPVRCLAPSSQFLSLSIFPLPLHLLVLQYPVGSRPHQNLCSPFARTDCACLINHISMRANLSVPEPPAKSRQYFKQVSQVTYLFSSSCCCCAICCFSCCCSSRKSRM